MNYTEADYLVAKLKGDLEHVGDIVKSVPVSAPWNKKMWGANVFALRQETYAEWKARMEFESKQ